MSINDNSSDYIKSNGRDLRLDFLRGLFVFIMIVDHIGGNSPLFYFTFGNKFFTSAAEGFYLISGIVTGFVYYKILQKEGLGAGIIKSARRLLSIYLVTVSLAVIVLFFVEHFHFQSSVGINLGHPVPIILDLLTFKKVYMFADVLFLYCLVFALLPYALILLYKHKTGWLCATSLGIYLIFLAFPESNFLPMATFMKASGIQLFFFGGVVLGYHKKLQNITPNKTLKWLFLSGSLFGLLIIFWNLDQAQSKFSHLISSQAVSQINGFFDKATVAPGRILVSIIVFGFLYLLLTRFWKIANRIVGWLMVPLGQHALIAYVIHIVTLMIILVISSSLNYSGNAFWLNGFIQLSGVLLIWLLVKKQLFIPNQKNKMFYYFIPVALIFVFIVFEKLYNNPVVYSKLGPIFHTIFSR
jgi:hypothetical protein